MAPRGVAAALLSSVALAHPGNLQCGDERFNVGSTTKCMTSDIVDKQEHLGLRFEASEEFYHPGTDVHLTLNVESKGIYNNSTGQHPYGIYFALLAKAPTSYDFGSFTAVPETVSPKDAVTCPHQIFSTVDEAPKEHAFTWTAGKETCGDVSFTVLWGNGPGDPPKAPAVPFLYRSVATIRGRPCETPATTTTTTAPAETWVCSICSHVYDADKDGAGSPFEDLPDDWKCPVCFQPKSGYKKQVHSTVAAETWLCDICSHVYDADKDGAGSAFEDLPDDWKCPVCFQPKSEYKKQVQTTAAAETWVCDICSHVFDADKDAAGSAFEDLPDDWKCPVCFQPKSEYKKQSYTILV